MVYGISALGLFVVFLVSKFVKMRTAMVHTSGENLATFIGGLLVAGVTNFVLILLNVNLPAWMPPVITILTALGSGFATMWGKDLYKAWKIKKEFKRDNKHKPLG